MEKGIKDNELFAFKHYIKSEDYKIPEMYDMTGKGQPLLTLLAD